MDVEALDAGDEFEELPETYVIFITERDVFGRGRGRGVYRFERADEDGTPFGDGSHVLYVNAQYDGDDDLGSLMRDFLRCDPDDMETESLARRTRYFKENPEGVSHMCKTMEDLREASRAEGRAEGREEGLRDSIASLMDTLKLSAQQAMDALKVPPEDQPRFLAML